MLGNEFMKNGSLEEEKKKKSSWWFTYHNEQILGQIHASRVGIEK